MHTAAAGLEERFGGVDVGWERDIRVLALPPQGGDLPGINGCSQLVDIGR
jgi:hypothetical protein